LFTDDSVEVAISFLKECGQKLTEVSPRGITAIFDRLRNVLHEADLDKRTQYMIEVMFQVKIIIPSQRICKNEDFPTNVS